MHTMLDGGAFSITKERLSLDPALTAPRTTTPPGTIPRSSSLTVRKSIEYMLSPSLWSYLVSTVNSHIAGAIACGALNDHRSNRQTFSVQDIVDCFAILAFATRMVIKSSSTLYKVSPTTTTKHYATQCPSLSRLSHRRFKIIKSSLSSVNLQVVSQHLNDAFSEVWMPTCESTIDESFFPDRSHKMSEKPLVPRMHMPRKPSGMILHPGPHCTILLPYPKAQTVILCTPDVRSSERHACLLSLLSHLWPAVRR